jgi:hypothetical protein
LENGNQIESHLKKHKKPMTLKELKKEIPNDNIINIIDKCWKIPEERIDFNSLHEEFNEMMNKENNRLYNVMCPISKQFFYKPVIAADGHTYEKKCIEDWFKKYHNSPLTREIVLNKHLIPNNIIKTLTNEYIKQYNISENLIFDKSEYPEE